LKVSVVIPAFNEEKTIGEVIQVAAKVDEVDEIIVVSDGSTDRTADIARVCGATVIENPHNLGKGGAMCVGVKSARNPAILFLDADLIGLKKEHIEHLVHPLLSGECHMSIGVFVEGRKTTNFSHRVAPFLSGQRAILKSLFEKIDFLAETRYGVEIALNLYCAKHELKTMTIYLDHITHVMKEEKLGLAKGFTARMRMYWEIVKCVNRVRLG
jgi:glycosyltransferase involved in cell wall biosynthesis